MSIISRLKQRNADFRRRARIVHHKRYNYSKVKYTMAHVKVCIICVKHGKFWQSPKNHLDGKGCNQCAKDSQSRLFRSTKREFVKKSRIVHGTKYDYSSVKYKSSNKKVEIICKRHGEFLQTPMKHVRGHGCSKCKYVISRPEIEFLDHLDINKKCRQIFINPYNVDGITPKRKIIYEFLGNYFHGNPEKFDREEYNKTCHKTFGELYDCTFKKFHQLSLLGYTIKYIWESDWTRFKRGKDIVPNIKTYGIDD